jgi:hypothetical protein
MERRAATICPCLDEVEPEGRGEPRPDSASAREGYDSGWDPVINSFASAALRWSAAS